MKYQAIDSEYIREMKERDEFLRQKGWLMKGMKYGYFIAILIILLSAFFNGNLVLAQTSNDISYTFQNDNLYNSTSGIYDDSFNVRNHSEYTSHYNATYSFENEIDGTNGTDIGFVDTVILYNGACEIIPDWQRHQKVLRLQDDADAGEDPTITNNFTSTTSGVVEFWIGTNDVTEDWFIHFREVSLTIIYLRIGLSKFMFARAGWHDVGKSAVNDMFYHCKVIWYADNTFDFWLNGVQYQDGEACNSNMVGAGVNDILIQCGGDSEDYLYLDAIGYSWDDTHYDNEFFDISSEDDWGTGITWDGTYFWVIGQGGQNAYQYTSAGVYTTVNFHYGNEDIAGNGITWDGTHFWIVGSFSDTVYQYTSTGVYTGFSFSVLSELTHPQGITWDGTYFWVVGRDADAVFKYNSTGNYTSDTFSVVSQDNNPSDIAWNGVYLYVLGYQNTIVYEYTTMGVYTGYYFDVSNEGNAHEGLVYAVDSFWTTEVVFDNAFKYLYVENPYFIGDNLVPYLNVSDTIKEVDKFEFLFETPPTYDYFETGDDNPSGWDDIEDGGDEVNCLSPSLVNIQTGSGDLTGLEKTDFAIDDDIHLNITFGFTLKDIGSALSRYLFMNVSSFDTTPVMSIYIDEDGNMGYYDGSYNVLDTGFVIDVFYEFYVFINHEIGNCLLSYYEDGVFNSAYVIQLFASGKIGLSEIIFYQESDTNTMQTYLDYIRVLSGGESVSTEMATLKYEMNVAEWVFDEFNLVSYYAICDDLNLHLVSHTAPPPTSVYGELTYALSVSGSEVINIYGLTIDSNPSMFNPDLWFTFFDTIEVYNMSIDGVKLIEGSNEYMMDLTYLDVNIDESYFYVIGDSLYFELEANENGLEYMQGSFDVNNVFAGNRSLSYRGLKSGTTISSQFLVNYVDSTYNFFDLEPNYKSLVVILPSDKMIDTFDLLISDDGSDLNDTITGFLGSFELLYVPLITTDFVSISFFDALPIVVLVVVVPIALYVGFGRKKELLVPSIIAMSIFGTAIGLIPLWLTFVIGFGCVAYYIMDRRN